LIKDFKTVKKLLKICSSFSKFYNLQL